MFIMKKEGKCSASSCDLKWKSTFPTWDSFWSFYFRVEITWNISNIFHQKWEKTFTDMYWRI